MSDPSNSPSGVHAETVRDRLVEVAAEVDWMTPSWPQIPWGEVGQIDREDYRRAAGRVLDVVLTVIADEIEAAAEADRRLRADETREARERGDDDVLCEMPHIECHSAAAAYSWGSAAALVRSWSS